MHTYSYAKKLRLLTIILLISLAFSSLLPNGVTIVRAQSPETATPEAVTTVTATATAVAPPAESTSAPDGAATPTGSAIPVQETPITSQTPPADSPTITASATPQTPAPSETPPAATPTLEAATPTPPAPPAQGPAIPDLPPVDFNLLADGQFVYGPNVGSFTIAAFAARSAPQLSPYAEALYGRAEFNSINPRLYLALMEMATGLVSNQSVTSLQVENPFGLAEPGFLPQLDALSQSLFNAYYLHLYNYSALPVDQRRLPALTLADGSTFDVPGAANAGSYAVLAGLASFKDAAGMAVVLDATQALSFAQTYRRLFPDDDPLSQANRVSIPGQLSYQAAPAGLLQFPYPRGEAWTFGGVHSNDGSSGDMSSIDFSKGWPAWGANTSAIWVAAAGGGVPSKVSSCNFHIDHGGGWMTTYYHLDNIQSYSGSIQPNDRIGTIANNTTQALCNGGSSTGPHVHFTLRYNGALVAINGTSLSGWTIHAGTSNYDTNHDHMWLIRNGVKKYAFVDPITNDTSSDAPCSAPSLSSPADGYISTGQALTFKWAAVYGCTFDGYTLRVKDTSNMDSGGNTILEKSLSDISQNGTVPAQWDDTTLYWGVRAANAANGAAWSVRHFLIPSSPNPPRLLNPAEGATLYSRQLTFTWQSPNAPNQNGYTLRLSVSSNPETSPWLVNTSPGSSLSSYSYTFTSDKTYYWHMRTLNTYGVQGAWVTRSFSVQGQPPGTPSLSVPAKNTLLYVYLPTLDWSDATGAAQYNLQVATGSTFLPADVRNTQVSLSTYPFTMPLPPNDTYYWRVQAINAHGVLGAWTAYSYFRTALNVPIPLYPANQGAALTTRPTFKWGEVKDNSGYAFQLSTSPTFSSKTVDTSVSGPAYTMTSDLGRGRVYYWRVRARGANQSAWSTPFSFTGANPPPIPALLSPASSTLLANYAPSLDWRDVIPVDHYGVQVSTSSKFLDGTILYPSTSDWSGFVVPADLPANATYYWRVCTYDALGQYSLWSASRTFRTPMLPPELITPADAGRALTTRPAFDWASVAGASSYTLQVSASPLFSKLLVSTSLTGSIYTPGSDLLRNQTLYWRVKANGTNPSAWSKVFSFTSADPPPAPVLATPSDGSALSVYKPTLVWNDVDKAAYYKIQISTSSSFTGASLLLSSTSSFVPPDALDTNTTYYWRVSAYNAANQYGPWSTARHLHTKVPAPLLGDPAKALALPVPVGLNWGSVNKATGYIVQVSSSASFSSTVVNKSLTTLSYTTSSLTKGKTYYWRVQAVAKYSSDWSEVRPFTVQ